MKIRIIRNKKGVSPAFVAIYLAMLAILLISVLFAALNIYGTSVTERMKMEEEKQQESVALAGPAALNLTAGEEFFEALRVNNTGTITIRIRALYINHNFICDPSTFQGDSYINGKGYLWIRLYPNVKITLDKTPLNATWTVTTERGTKAYETTERLLWGKPDNPYNPMRFYIGPLMIMFDMFHWRSGTGPWQNGWSIPKNTIDVTWRILISNIDNRDIEVTDKSSLTLISNDNAPNAPVPWYIDPALSSLYYKPGSFYFIYYAWSKPVSEGGSSRQSANGFGDGTTCITFLMFLGSFIEPNGTRTSYGQTIPFEAVHVTTETMPASLKLVANPENIPNNGVSTSTITATVQDSKGNPVPNAWVDFYTTAGTLSATHETTNAQGMATVTITSTTARTTAYIAALCQGVEGTARVSFTPARKIKISANPTTVSKDGGTSRITVQLIDTNNVNVTQKGITIAVTVSNWDGPGSKWPILIYDDQPGQTSLTVATDANGQLILTFKAMGGTKGKTFQATVTAQASGLTSDSVTINVKG